MLRPFTMLAAFISGVCIVILYSEYYNTEFSIKNALSTGIILSMLQGAGQVMNQSIQEEVEIDKLNGKTYRPTVTGIISLTEGKIFSFLLTIIAAALAYNLSSRFGFWTLVIAFFAIFYTAPPLRIKKRFLINNAWQGFSRGFLPWVMVWSLSGKYDLLPFALGTVVGVWMMGYQATKDFGDILGDRKYNIKTMPVVYGIDISIIFILLMGAIGFSLLTLFVIFKIISIKYLLLLILIIPSIAIVKELRNLRTSPLIENNRAWGMMYATLGLFYLLPAIIAWI